jgi:hypothetical protein
MGLGGHAHIYPEIQTGYVLESLVLEFDTISLPQRQTYGVKLKS